MVILFLKCTEERVVNLKIYYIKVLLTLFTPAGLDRREYDDSFDLHIFAKQTPATNKIECK